MLVEGHRVGFKRIESKEHKKISCWKCRLGFGFQTRIVFDFNDSRRFQHVPDDKETVWTIVFIRSPFCLFQILSNTSENVSFDKSSPSLKLHGLMAKKVYNPSIITMR